MNRVWIALGTWFLLLIAGITLAVWLHNVEHPNPGWEPGFIMTVKEKISYLRKRLKDKIKKRKKRS